jgi:hypothetical protein
MKTAVEWIETRAEEREINNPNESAYWHLRELIKDFQQAKEMEKEQMIKFAKHCLDKSIDLDILMAYNQVEIEYTNQTFKSE